MTYIAPDTSSDTHVTDDYSITLENPSYRAAIEDLHHRAFGPGRFAKTAFRLREGVAPVEDLCLVGLDQAGTLQGSVIFTPVDVAGESGFLLLGPLAVEPALRGRGLGVRLMQEGIARARDLGYAGIVLVGDLPYYARVGFEMANPFALSMTGPVDPNRLLVLALRQGAFDGLTGKIGRPS